MNISFIPKSVNGAILLMNSIDDQADTFFGKNIPYGIYILEAQLSHQSEAASIINLSASKQIEIKKRQEQVHVLLEKLEGEG